MTVTQSLLKECISYNPISGEFVWIKGYNNRNIGKVAGMIDVDGYRVIKFKKRIWRAHHLAWLYVNGEFPRSAMDHIDGNRSNNAITNLRVVTFSGNSQNQRVAHKDAKYGMLGVDKLSHRKLFRARIATGGKRVTLGYFKTPEEAHSAYLAAKRIMHITCTI